MGKLAIGVGLGDIEMAAAIAVSAKETLRSLLGVLVLDDRRSAGGRSTMVGVGESAGRGDSTRVVSWTT
jgi:hypothetical protein